MYMFTLEKTLHQPNHRGVPLTMKYVGQKKTVQLCIDYGLMQAIMLLMSS